MSRFLKLINKVYEILLRLHCPFPFYVRFRKAASTCLDTKTVLANFNRYKINRKLKKTNLNLNGANYKFPDCFRYYQLVLLSSIGTVHIADCQTIVQNIGAEDLNILCKY